MKLFRLSRNLRTGIALIDEQHRQYGRFVNAFLKMSAKQETVAYDSLVKAFSFLHSYARDHLAAEESLMATYNYPDRAVHIERHHYFANWIESAQSALLSGPVTQDQFTRVNYMLVEWFQTHIRSEDKRLAAHLMRVANESADQRLLNLIHGVLGTLR